MWFNKQYWQGTTQFGIILKFNSWEIIEYNIIQACYYFKTATINS